MEVIPSDGFLISSAKRNHNSELAVAECPLAIVYDPPKQTKKPNKPAKDNYPSLLLTYTKVHRLASPSDAKATPHLARACSVDLDAGMRLGGALALPLSSRAIAGGAAIHDDPLAE